MQVTKFLGELTATSQKNKKTRTQTLLKRQSEDTIWRFTNLVGNVMDTRIKDEKKRPCTLLKGRYKILNDRCANHVCELDKAWQLNL